MALTVETKTHTIEVSGGCLTIGEHASPDNSVTLSPEDTQTVLNVLLADQMASRGVVFSGKDGQLSVTGHQYGVSLLDM